MLSYIVGNVDVPSAAVLIAFFGGVTIMVTSFIAKYQSKQDFELNKFKVESEERRLLYQYETDRVYKTTQLEQNLITSHCVKQEG
jgi:hypothetical protein